VDRTFVIQRGRTLSYFAGCDYFRLASHPEVLGAVSDALERFGLNVAASRKTTGNHVIYGQLEEELTCFFECEAAVLVSNGYLTNLVVAQALAGDFTHALIDERAHGSLFDAAGMLGCPIIHYPHRDAQAVAAQVRSLGARAKVLVLTDGLFPHCGEVAPLDQYLRGMPRGVMLLVDDAHGAGTLGKNGRGTAEFLGVPSRRVIQTITFSKALGVYGGAVLGSRLLRERIIERSRLFVGNTPLPPPLVAGTLAALALLGAEPGFRRRLAFNTAYVKAALRRAGRPVNDGPGPIVPLLPQDGAAVEKLRRALLRAGIHPPYINYRGGPADGYFRFVLSSEHTAAQLDALVGVLGPCAGS